MAKDLVDLFEDDLDEKALVRVASKFDEKDYDDLSNPAVMQTFYKRLFPVKQIYLWLNQEQVPTKNWTHREIAFTLANDAYLRYNSFSTHLDFQKELVRLNPSRFEIGPVYNARPKDKRQQLKTALKPLRRELVFDIDMTDYDEIRTCCQDKKICTRCWKFIAIAVKLLDRTLRDDFGFQHLLWVYSGRRGIHCWISDSVALDLTDEQRRAVVGYLEVIKGGAHQAKKVDLPRPLHTSLRSVVDTLTGPFNRVILEDQDCFRTEQGWETLLKLLPSGEPPLVALQTKLENRWRGGNDQPSKVRWQTLVDEAAAAVQSEDNSKKRPLLAAKINSAIEDIKLQYLYPRIDAEVSKHRNHLLKSPFVVHPGTGRVCVPVNPELIEDFDPERVPTVGLLLRQLDEASRGLTTTPVSVKNEDGTTTQTGPSHQPGWEATSLKPYVDMFEKHIAAVMKDTMRAKRAVKQETFDF